MNQPLHRNSHDNAILGYYKRNSDQHYAVFLNRGNEPVELSFAISGLPEGQYALRKSTLETEERLGQRVATEIAESVSAGLLAPDRMAVVTLLRLP
jgi:hypothetical protein